MITIIKNVNILNANMSIIEKHDVYIKNGTILGFDLNISSNKKIEGNDKTLLPKFFNMHTHLGESLYKLKMNNLTILNYIEETNEINEKMTEEEKETFWNKSANKTIKLLKKEHTIGFCSARSAEISLKNEMISMSGYPLMNSIKLKHYYEKGVCEFHNYFKKYNSDKVSVGIFLHSLYFANIDILKFASDCFDESEFLVVHVSEDYITRKKELDLYNDKPVFVMEKYKLLSNKTIIVHGAYLDDDELDLIAKYNCTIVICPISNKNLHTNSMDLNKLICRNIRWMIGTDGLLTAGSQSLIKQINYLKKKYPLISNQEFLKAITLYPAELLNRSLYRGYICRGVSAKFMLVNDDFHNISESTDALFNNKLEVMDLDL